MNADAWISTDPNELATQLRRCERSLRPSLPLAADLLQAAAEKVERLQAQLLQHAETCKESAWPLGEPGVERHDAPWFAGCAQRMEEVATYLRSRRDGDHMDRDAAVDVDRGARALREIAAERNAQVRPGVPS